MPSKKSKTPIIPRAGNTIPVEHITTGRTKLRNVGRNRYERGGLVDATKNDSTESTPMKVRGPKSNE